LGKRIVRKERNNAVLRKHVRGGTPWVQLDNAYNVFYKKVGGITFVQSRYTGTTLNAGNQLVGTLPEGFRPDFRVNVRDGANNNGYIQIETDGKVYLNPSTNTSYFQCMASYPVV